MHDVKRRRAVVGTSCAVARRLAVMGASALALLAAVARVRGDGRPPADMRERRARRTIRAVSVAVTAITVFAVAGSAADARIVINRSIAGVRVDDSLHRVHEVLGKPQHVRYTRDEITGGKDRIDVYRGLSVTTIAGRVFGITTTRRREHATGGIHVGITLRALKRRLKRQGRHVHCFHAAGRRSCAVARYLDRPNMDPAGQLVTDFEIRHGHVRRIGLGRVVD